MRTPSGHLFMFPWDARVNLWKAAAFVVVAFLAFYTIGLWLS